MILVLDPASPRALVDEVCGIAQQLGWRSDVSWGEEQVVVALGGSADPEELEAALSAFELDVLQLPSSRAYGRMRSRRRMMTGIAAGLGLLSAAGIGVPILGFLMPPRGALADPDLVEAGNVDEFREGTARVIPFHGVPVFVVRFEGDRYHALSATCTYMKFCRLEWDGERRLLRCPCHGGVFDVYGNVVDGLARIPLTRYDVVRVGDTLFLRRAD